MKIIIYCSDLSGWDCCSSCHSEWDDGYGDSMEYDVGKKFAIRLCCRRGNPPVDLETREGQLVVLKLYRAGERGKDSREEGK